MKLHFLLPAALLFAHSAPAEILARFDFADGSTASTDTSPYSIVPAYDARSAAIAGDDSAVSSITETAYMRAENTPATTNPGTNSYYHTFSIEVAGLAAGESLDLTALSLTYTATQIYQTFSVGTYSDAVGYSGTGDKLADIDIATNAGGSFKVDLTAANPVAGTAFTGLTNDQTIEFRFVFSDNSTANNRIHRLDDIVLHGTVDRHSPQRDRDRPVRERPRWVRISAKAVRLPVEGKKSRALAVLALRALLALLALLALRALLAPLRALLASRAAHRLLKGASENYVHPTTGPPQSTWTSAAAVPRPTPTCKWRFEKKGLCVSWRRTTPPRVLPWLPK